MHKFGKALLILLSATCLIFSAAFIAGCTEEKEEEVFYSVTTQYNPSEGSVEISEPASEKGYAKNEEVTVTVVALEGFEVDVVTVNDTAVTLSDGTYKFNVEGDTQVAATFKEENGVQNPPVQNPPEDIVTKYTVTVGEYDELMGSVTLSSPAEGDDYAEGEDVTVTVTAGDGYAIGIITVNGTPVRHTDGVYTFTITQDTVITVTFTVYSSGEDGILQLFRGDWTSVSGGKMRITGGQITVYDSEIAYADLAQEGTSNQATYVFTLNGVTYGLSWANYVYTQGYVLSLLNYTSGGVEYFIKDSSLSGLSIDQSYIGEWYNAVGDYTGTTALVITETTITYDGKLADYVVDLGYITMTPDSEPAPVYNNTYAFFVGGQMYLLSWYRPGETDSNGNYVGGNPTVNVYSYIKDTGKEYEYAADFRGTWTGLEGDTVIEITQWSLTINGEPGTIRPYNEYGFYLDWNDVEYWVRPYYGFEGAILVFESYTYDEYGRISGFKNLYFINSNIKEVAVSEDMYGVWKSTQFDEYTAMADCDDITISAEGVFWGEDKVTVIQAGESREDGYTYVVATRGGIYELSYLNYYAGYEDEDNPGGEGGMRWLLCLSSDSSMYYLEKVD